nr:MAG TPA: hypothetical protein [Caudoviricetes sp.]
MLFLYLNPISHHNLSCYFITSIGICFQKLEMQSTDVILFQWPICKPGRSDGTWQHRMNTRSTEKCWMKFCGTKSRIYPLNRSGRCLSTSGS